jgi:hypothetical protein
LVIFGPFSAIFSAAVNYLWSYCVVLCELNTDNWTIGQNIKVGGRIQIRIRIKSFRIMIWEAQKGIDPTELDPENCPGGGVFSIM